ncbi:MAG: hypothetical protein H8E91_00050 [Planctomycetes bacterium]|nr:hypothetical protein [Planctomycetota bacterium]
MSRHSFLLLFLACWGVCLVGIHYFGYRKKLDQVVLVLSHLVPSVVAIVMVYFFVVKKLPTVAQFAGTDEAFQLQIAWGNFLVQFIYFIAANTFILFVCGIVVGIKPPMRKWLAPIITSIFLSVFALFAAVSHFPTA